MIGWIANIIILVGMIGIGDRKRSAFLVTMIGEVIWATVGITRGEIDLTVICVLFAGIAGRNYLKWK